MALSLRTRRFVSVISVLRNRATAGGSLRPADSLPNSSSTARGLSGEKLTLTAKRREFEKHA